MEINISGAALVRLALWLAVAAVVIGMVIGAKTSPTRRPPRMSTRPTRRGSRPRTTDDPLSTLHHLSSPN